MVAEDSSFRKKLAEFRSSLYTHYTRGIWAPVAGEASKGKRLLRRVERIGYILVRGFRDHGILARAPSLTLAYLLALVPLLLLIQLGATSLGLREKALGWLRQYLTDYATVGQHEVVEIIIRSVESVNAAALGGVGLVFLLYTAFGMLETIESTFNNIWGVNEGRSFLRKLAVYPAALFVFPVLIFASFALTATIGSLEFAEQVRDTTILTGGVNFMLKAVQLLSIVIGFMLTYKYIPYTRVRWLPAFLAGCVAGLTAYLVQWVFIEFQIGVTNNNLIYGTFAALPIFLAWLNLSWIIVLVGCEIAYAVQHESSYRPSIPAGLVSISQRERAALQVLVRACKRANDGLPPESAGAIAAEIDLPRRVTTEIIEALVHCSMLVRSAKPERALLPASDLSHERVGDLFLAYRHAGKISHGDLGGFLDETVCAFHDRLEAALRHEGLLKLSALADQ